MRSKEVFNSSFRPVVFSLRHTVQLKSNTKTQDVNAKIRTEHTQRRNRQQMAQSN